MGLGATFALFGMPPGDPVPVADLPSHVVPDDVPAVQGFREALLHGRMESAAAFRVVRADQALEEADEAERRRGSADDAPLLGVPIAVKDTVDVAGKKAQEYFSKEATGLDD